MKAGLVGPSSVQRSLPFDSQRTVNFHAVLDQDGKNAAALYSRPGLNQIGTTGLGPGRGALAVANGRVFVVSGSGFYEENGDGTSILWGSLNQNTGIVTMAENSFQVAICDGTSLYIFKYADNSFQIVSNPNLPSAYSVIFLGGYFIVNKSLNSGIFQISAPYDGTSWAALDFATAESSPDALVRVLNVGGQLWLIGTTTIEIWSNTGAAAFPFQLVNASSRISIGTASPFSCLQLDNSMFWIGRDINGIGIVYRAQGYSPQRISTDPIELRIQAASDPSSLFGMSYQEAGHTFYIITGGGMETALVYDLSTNLWTEWAFLNDSGNYELPLTSFLFYAFGKTLALDKNNGNVYQQSGDFYSDNGREIARDRTFTHLFNASQRFQIKNLAVYFETGVGNVVDPASNPVCLLYLSKDGGRSFGNPYVGLIGRVGEFMPRGVMFWRLGSYFQCTFRVRVTDQIKVAISGAEFNTQ